MAEENNENKVNEPGAEYTPEKRLGDLLKTLTISSMEEMEKDNYRHWNSLTPEQRLAEHYEMIIRIYKDQLEKGKGTLYDKIYFHE